MYPEEGGALLGDWVPGAEKERLPRNPPERPPPALAQTSLEIKAKVKTRMIPIPKIFAKDLSFGIAHLIF